MCWSSEEAREWLEAQQRELDEKKKDDELTWVSDEGAEKADEPERERELIHA